MRQQMFPITLQFHLIVLGKRERERGEGKGERGEGKGERERGRGRGERERGKGEGRGERGKGVDFIDAKKRREEEEKTPFLTKVPTHV